MTSILEKCMSCKYRNEKSANGFTMDVLKSAIQKYIRRGNSKEAIYAAIEMWMFICILPFNPKAKSILTNLIHRLQIIYLEDVGFVSNKESNIKKWKLMNKYIEKIKTRTKKGSNSLVYMINNMAESKHIRFASHVNSIEKFARLKNWKKYSKDFPLLAKYKSEIKDYLDLNLNTTNSDEREKILKTLKSELSKALKKKSLTSYFFARSIDLIGKDHAKGALRSLDKKKLFDYIKEDTNLSSELISIAKEWYKDLKGVKEVFLTYYGLISIWLMESIGNKEEEKDIKEPLNVREIYSKNIETVGKNNEKRFDDFIYDMHTREGRKNKSNRIDFANEGSKVVNEFKISSKFEELERFYIFEKGLAEGKIDKTLLKVKSELKDDTKSDKSKEEKDESEDEFEEEKDIKESDIFSDFIRTQVSTSANKTDAFFGLLKTRIRGFNQDVIFCKGPFTSKKPIETFILIQDLKRKLKLPYVKAEIIFLIPDLITDTTLGVRNKLSVKDKKKSHPYLITENLLTIKKEEWKKIPRVKKETKMWNTTVINWEKMDTFLPKVSKNLNKDNIGPVLKDYVTLIYFRYIFGISDLADRNFMIKSVEDETKDVLYSIDEEVIGQDINIYTNLKKTRCEMINKYLKKEEEYYIELLKSWKKVILIEKVKGSKDRYSLLMENIAMIFQNEMTSD